MRISDWSSDVCSSDLNELLEGIYVLRILESEEVTRRRMLVRAGRAVIAIVAIGKAGVDFNCVAVRTWACRWFLEGEHHNVACVIAKNVVGGVPGSNLS